MAITQGYKKIEPQLKAFIADSILEILADPDYGLSLRESFKKKLRAAQRSKARKISLSDIRKKYY